MTLIAKLAKARAPTPRTITVRLAILIWALALAAGLASGYILREPIENPPCLVKRVPHPFEIWPCGWMEG